MAQADSTEELAADWKTLQNISARQQLITKRWFEKTKQQEMVCEHGQIYHQPIEPTMKLSAKDIGRRLQDFLSIQVSFEKSIPRETVLVVNRTIPQYLQCYTIILSCLALVIKIPILTLDRSIYVVLRQFRRLEHQILVLFLESRGPSTFARTDIEALHIRTIANSIEEPEITPALHSFLSATRPRHTETWFPGRMIRKLPTRCSLNHNSPLATVAGL